MRLGDPNFVVLLDFGLAKMFAGQSAVKTAAGVLLGTPQYMSPEACESRGNLDHRTDIYALGILLFQMMTGMLPFDGETMGEVLVKQVTQLPPPPRGFNGSIPPSVEQIVLRCLAKSPDQRFPTMLALREALLDPEAYLRKSPPMSPARSLAPGEVKVDAKTIMAYAQQEQQQKATQIGMSGAPLPLAAPPPSNPGTNAAKTMIADGNLVPPRAPAMPAPPPEMVVPNQPKMNTMRIATPLGYSSRPPRKMWPIVLVVALLLGLGGGAFAVVYFGDSDEAASTAVPHDARIDAPATKVATPPPPPPASADAAVAVAPVPVDAAAPAVPTAIIVIDSTPQGADVIGPDKQVVGKTPAQVTLPISDLPLTFELRLAGYKKKIKQVIVSGNTVISVSLDKAPSSNSGSTTHKKGSGSGNELMRPDDL
jgi:serine/threonine-protein kinase